MAVKWVKKPVVIEAVQYNGENIEEIKEFASESLVTVSKDMYSIRTLEGKMLITKGDYIIKGIKGEFYPCKSDIFYETYKLHLVWEDNI